MLHIIYIAFSFHLLIYVTSALTVREPHNNNHGGGNHGNCLTRDDAETIMTNFISLFENFDKQVAVKTVTKDFQLFSDSTNNFVGLPPGAPTLTDRADMISAFTVDPTTCCGATAYNVLNSSHSCDTIHYRWRVPSTPKFLTGINYLVVDRNSGLVATAYSEYNAVAALQDNGLCAIPS